MNDMFLCHFDQNGASMNPIKIVGRNRIFPRSRTEFKPIKN